MPTPKNKKKNDSLEYKKKLSEASSLFSKPKGKEKTKDMVDRLIKKASAKKSINKAKYRNDASYRDSVRRRPKSLPPKTAMDSVRTMPDKSMKKDTINQMKKKDMRYGGKKPTTAQQRISDIDKMMAGAPSDSKKRLKKRKASIQKQMASKKKPMTYGGKKMRYGGMKKGKKC